MPDKKPIRKMSVKERHRMRLLEFLSDPNNDFPCRKEYATILGINLPTVYHHFPAIELSEIEYEAVEARKRNASKQRAEVLSGLYKRAIGYSHPDVHISTYMGEVTITDITKHYPPDPSAAKEFLDRVEGRVPSKDEVSGPGGTPLFPARIDIIIKKAGGSDDK